MFEQISYQLKATFELKHWLPLQKHTRCIPWNKEKW